jgi:hypothetical protein
VVYLHGDLAADGTAWCSRCRRFRAPEHFAAHADNLARYRAGRTALSKLAMHARVIRPRKNVNLFVPPPRATKRRDFPLWRVHG